MDRDHNLPNELKENDEHVCCSNDKIKRLAKQHLPSISMSHNVPPPSNVTTYNIPIAFLLLSLLLLLFCFFYYSTFHTGGVT